MRVPQVIPHKRKQSAPFLDQSTPVGVYVVLAPALHRPIVPMWVGKCSPHLDRVDTFAEEFFAHVEFGSVDWDPGWRWRPIVDAHAASLLANHRVSSYVESVINRIGDSPVLDCRAIPFGRSARKVLRARVLPAASAATGSISAAQADLVGVTTCEIFSDWWATCSAVSRSERFLNSRLCGEQVHSLEVDKDSLRRFSEAEPVVRRWHAGRDDYDVAKVRCGGAVRVVYAAVPLPLQGGGGGATEGDQGRCEHGGRVEGAGGSASPSRLSNMVRDAFRPTIRWRTPYSTPFYRLGGGKSGGVAGDGAGVGGCGGRAGGYGVLARRRAKWVGEHCGRRATADTHRMLQRFGATVNDALHLMKIQPSTTLHDVRVVALAVVDAPSCCGVSADCARESRSGAHGARPVQRSTHSTARRARRREARQVCGDGGSEGCAIAHLRLSLPAPPFGLRRRAWCRERQTGSDSVSRWAEAGRSFCDSTTTARRREHPSSVARRVAHRAEKIAYTQFRRSAVAAVREGRKSCTYFRSTRPSMVNHTYTVDRIGEQWNAWDTVGSHARFNSAWSWKDRRTLGATFDVWNRRWGSVESCGDSLGAVGGVARGVVCDDCRNLASAGGSETRRSDGRLPIGAGGVAVGTRQRGGLHRAARAASAAAGATAWRGVCAGNFRGEMYSSSTKARLRRHIRKWSCAQHTREQAVGRAAAAARIANAIRLQTSAVGRVWPNGIGARGVVGGGEVGGAVGGSVVRVPGGLALPFALFEPPRVPRVMDVSAEWGVERPPPATVTAPVGHMTPELKGGSTYTHAQTRALRRLAEAFTHRRCVASAPAATHTSALASSASPLDVEVPTTSRWRRGGRSWGHGGGSVQAISDIFRFPDRGVWKMLKGILGRRKTRAVERARRAREDVCAWVQGDEAEDYDGADNEGGGVRVQRVAVRAPVSARTRSVLLGGQSGGWGGRLVSPSWTFAEVAAGVARTSSPSPSSWLSVRDCPSPSPSVPSNASAFTSFAASPTAITHALPLALSSLSSSTSAASSAVYVCSSPTLSSPFSIAPYTEGRCVSDGGDGGTEGEGGGGGDNRCGFELL